MNKIYFIVLGVLLSGCWPKQDPLSFERRVKVEKVEALNSYSKRFAALVHPSSSVDLAFGVSGLVNNMYAAEGEMVKKDQILASLDDDDFRLQVSSALSNYNATKSILERTERLQARDAVSLQDLELAKADYVQAKSNYSYALNQLSYTKLYAPFAGSIESQGVDTYQEVNAGTLIYRLITPYDLDIKFTLPEVDANMLLQPVKYWVVFDNMPLREFKAELTSVINGSVLSAGIPITLKITDKNFDAQRLNIKVGFSCTVIMQLYDNKEFSSYVSVPLSALVNTNKLWVYSPSDSKVHLREVATAGLVGEDMVIISRGLKKGEIVVSAGVNMLTQGQSVKVLE
ncbi:MAG: efflux RND transporter periplasmic adaptor subunit [Rikenellaceae bacterium]